MHRCSERCKHCTSPMLTLCLDCNSLSLAMCAEHSDWRALHRSWLAPSAALASLACLSCSAAADAYSTPQELTTSVNGCTGTCAFQAITAWLPVIFTADVERRAQSRHSAQALLCMRDTSADCTENGVLSEEESALRAAQRKS